MVALLPCVTVAAEPVEWAAYGRDVEGTRYAPIADITPSNVAQLEVAWTYHTGELEPKYETEEETALEATPLVVDGVMFLSTPLGRVIALDPETGKERWTFDPKIDRSEGYGDFTNRGVSTWRDPEARHDAACARRIYVATIDARLIALDAKSGKPCRDFGSRGTVDLRKGLRIKPFEFEAYQMTSPPLAMNGLVVTGSSIGDNSRIATASGEVRAFDARSGKLRWTWDPIPQSPHDPEHASWAGSAAGTGGANAWSALSGDPERGLVFVPSTSPAPDYFGGLRPGANRYANSIVALHAATGKLAWQFQTVHHDLWDYDNASPPALATLRRDGRDVPAVLQATKSGQLFVLHRETGVPLFEVEERKVPASDVPDEKAWPTQPFNAQIPPLSPHRFEATQAWGANDADREACAKMVAGLRNEGIYTPPSLKGTLVIPSNIGGAHWGGVAVDPARQLAVVPVNRIAAMVQLIPAKGFDRRQAQDESDRLDLGYEYNVMVGTPYAMRRRLLLSPSGLPCTPPPFGALVAVDLAKGTLAWSAPLGVMQGRGGEKPKPDWGSPNLGGPMITAGGVVFIAATLDRKLHAFDLATGKALWEGQLPAGGKATPVSYRAKAGGRQFVVVAAGGGGAFGKGDAIVAFALPKD